MIPANLMTDFIEVRDKQQELFYNDSLFEEKLIVAFPEIKNTSIYQDKFRKTDAINDSASALSNELTKESIIPIEKEKKERNELIQATFWFNPLAFFQNKLNTIGETHYSDYQQYRNDIQALIDKRTAVLVEDLWNDVKVDQERYLQYSEVLSKMN